MPLVDIAVEKNEQHLLIDIGTDADHVVIKPHRARTLVRTVLG
jgi:hypothetical protein